MLNTNIVGWSHVKRYRGHQLEPIVNLCPDTIFEIDRTIIYDKKPDILGQFAIDLPPKNTQLSLF